MGRKKKPARLTPQQLAEWQTAPEYRAAHTVARVDKSDNVAVLAFELLKQSRAIGGGDMARPCDLLTAQAHTLDALFNKLAGLALVPGQGFDNQERLLRLALKAQGQCARTLEVLGNLKNPRLIVAGQANITSGPQQINNGTAQARETIVTGTGGCGEPSRAGVAETGQTQLLEHTHGERLDGGAQGAAGGSHQPLEALGAVYRPQD